MTDNRTKHTVTIGGVEHTVLIDPDDAKRYGVGAAPKAPEAEADDDAATKTRTPANKARGSRAK